MSQTLDKTKQWVALTVVGCLALLAAGWFLLVSPKRADAQDLRDERTSQDQLNQVAKARLDLLVEQSAQMPQQRELLADRARKVPADPALPALLRTLQQAADDTDVELVGITPGAAAPAAPAGAPAPAAAPAQAPAPAAAPATGAASGFVSIPLTLDAVGGYFQLQQFLTRLEELPRALRVTGLALAPGGGPAATGTAAAVEKGEQLTATITAEVFALTSSTTPSTAAAPAGSAPAATGAGPAFEDK